MRKPRLKQADLFGTQRKQLCPCGNEKAGGRIVCRQCWEAVSEKVRDDFYGGTLDERRAAARELLWEARQKAKGRAIA